MNFREFLILTAHTMTILTMTITVSKAQHLGSARGIGIGGFSALGGGISSIDWNPAGLDEINDWHVGVSNYFSKFGGRSGVTLNSMGVGKKLFDRQAVAAAYSPGKVIEFLVPAVISIYDTAGNEISANFDRKISYHQRYSFGYSYRLPENISIGFSAHSFETSVTETEYVFDPNYLIRSQTRENRASMWTMDVGAIYSLDREWRFGLVFKNLFDLREEELPDAENKYGLRIEKSARAGVAYTWGDGYLVGADIDDEKNARAGVEWCLIDWLQFRGGLYGKKMKNVEAFSLGMGVSYSSVQIDMSYLRFSDRSTRTGLADIGSFTSASYGDIDYTPFTPDQLTLSVNLKLGKTRETLARIEYVEMTGEVFTAAHQIYAFRPIGKARVRNITSKPIDAKVSFYIDDLMNAPTETRSYPIPPDEAIEIPFFAVFGDIINSVKKFSIFDGTVFVHAEISADYDDKYQTRVLIRGRNDWDGDVLSLKYFVTPDDPEIMRFTRSVLNDNKEHLDTITAARQNFEKARLIFDAYSKLLLYVRDPRKSKDFVQYPSETMSLHGGDCDDMTVGYSSLLMSVGIATAFIDVIPPERTEEAHIYMMFDSGISPDEAYQLSDNQKRYVVRRNDRGIETIWIPIETTAISNGFDKAWSAGSLQYFQDAEVNLGLIKGWMRVVDLQPSY